MKADDDHLKEQIPASELRKQTNTMTEDNHSSKSSRRAAASSSKSSLNSSTKEPGGRGSPSGFVLKLYQMVNGAPDNILSVSLAN